MARPSAPAGVLSRLGLALLVSALAGVLVAGLAAPVIGGVGLLAKTQTDDFLGLPAELDTPALATRTTVLAADGSVLATFYQKNRVEAPFDSIPLSMRQAIVAIEDSRFYEHNGVDYKGIGRAAVENLKSGGVAQGASTLTQQYVKNALLEAATDQEGVDAARADTLERKLAEARYALALEEKLSKDEILHRYLDIAYFGNGVYGIGTAATYYFNKPVDQLTLPESALLAGVVQNPKRYDVASKDPGVLADLTNRRDTVLARMRDVGYVTEPARAEAAATPLTPVDPVKVGQDCAAPDVTFPFFCDYVRHELEDTPVGAALGADPAARQNRLFTGGLTIRTSLDPRVQAAAQAGVSNRVPATDASGLAAASDVVEPGTGHILAMAQSKPYGKDPAQGQTQINLATGGTQGVQSGSTFKVFFLAAALQEGIPLATKIDSPARYTPTSSKCPGYEKRPVTNAGDSEQGLFDLRTGTHDSVNTFYIQLAERVGLEKGIALAEQLGVQKVVGSTGTAPLDRFCSTVLGAQTVSPLMMAAAYATFPAHGTYCAPRAVLGITAADGSPVALPPDDCKQAMTAGVADTVTSVLTGVIDGSTSGRTGSGASLGRPAAGKTGTTNDSQAAWFVGYTPQYATATWLGGFPNPVPMANERIGGRYYPGQMYGGKLPATIWKETMQGALKGIPAKAFAPADPAVVRGTGSTSQAGRVPDVSGMTYTQAAAELSAAGFAPARGRAVASRLSAGKVTYTSPRAGRSADPGDRVYVYTSTGRRPVAPTTAPAAPRPQAPVAPTTPQQQPPPPPAPTTPADPVVPPVPAPTG